MGKQVRKVGAWGGMVDSHMLNNFNAFRMYRWSSYHSHPTMTLGAPFKGRFGRVSPGVLATPDIYKYKIPIPIAFVFPNPEKEGRNLVEGKNVRNASPRANKKLLSSGEFKLNSECQQQVINFNNCLRNNKTDTCTYYSNYLNSHCLN